MEGNVLPSQYSRNNVRMYYGIVSEKLDDIINELGMVGDF